MGRTNMHKAPVQSQLSKFDMTALKRNARPERVWASALTRRDMARTTERRHEGANGKQAARMFTGHLCGHNLANLIRAPSTETTQPKCVWASALN